jgi:hypothetical protein
VPFGEVFIEERNKKWNTPYLFNAKELDEETGLYYYGARYYDPSGMEGRDDGGGFFASLNNLVKWFFFGDQELKNMSPEERKNPYEVTKYRLLEMERGTQRTQSAAEYIET